MKLTFELIATTDLNSFNEMVNVKLANGYRFITDQPITVIPHENISGKGYQYSVPMLLEES